jgi:hypothetical protein
MFSNLKFRKLSEHRATESEVKKFQKGFNLKLPSVFVDFCYQYNGGFPLGATFVVPAKFEEFHKEYPISKGLRIDFIYGLNPSLEQVQILSNKQFFEKSATVRLLPIAEDLLGNFAVVRCDTPEGNVFWLDHEIWDAPDVPHLFSIADDLRFFYENLRSKEE